MSTLSNQQADDDRRSIDDWASDHRIESWLLPLRTRKDDPVELVRLYTNAIAEMGKYQATFTTSDVGRQFHSGYAKPMRRMFLLREVSTTSRKNRYVNPNYAHLGHHEPSITDDSERVAFFDFFKDSPFVECDFFATHFGMTEADVRYWISQQGVEWADYKLENKARLARTLYTIWTWDTNDHSQMDLARAMPGETRTIHRWITRWGTNADDWEPPSPPTGEPWWKRHNGNANP